MNQMITLLSSLLFLLMGFAFLVGMLNSPKSKRYKQMMTLTGICFVLFIGSIYLGQINFTSRVKVKQDESEKLEAPESTPVEIIVETPKEEAPVKEAPVEAPKQDEAQKAKDAEDARIKAEAEAKAKAEEAQKVKEAEVAQKAKEVEAQKEKELEAQKSKELEEKKAKELADQKVIDDKAAQEKLDKESVVPSGENEPLPGDDTGTDKQPGNDVNPGDENKTETP